VGCAWGRNFYWITGNSRFFPFAPPLTPLTSLFT
jgi:hypothetical protein